MLKSHTNTSENQANIILHWSGKETQARTNLLELLKACPIPENELLEQLPLFVSRQVLTSILYLNYLYQQILEVNGVIMEFGVRWGRNLAILQALRGIYEPYNYTRRIIGFDTFEGFPSVAPQDGNSEVIKIGAYDVTEGYQSYLEQLLAVSETQSPIPHIKKWELVRGDVTVTLKDYLKRNPQTIISFAYFDLDLYEPTKAALEEIRPYLTKGSVIAFDELNLSHFPGETVAVREVLGLDKYKIHRWPHCSVQSYLVVE